MIWKARSKPATLLEHLAKSKSYVKTLIEENLYVDNVILSTDNWEETLPICREAKRIFESGGFKLHEFASNHIAAMKKLPPDDKIKEELALPLDKIQLWTDSENLLKWLGGNEKQKDCFINRRLEFISDWNVNYVPTKENPADIASRGIKAEDLINSELWLNGPPWLNTKLEEENWQSSSPYNYIAGDKKEKEQIFHSIQAANIKQEKGEEPIELFRAIGISTTEALLKNGVRYKSAWRKMKGTAAIVARFLVKILSKEAKHPFINEWREIVKEGPLTAEELSLGEKIIIRSTQRNISENGLDTIPGKLFEDEDRILRSGGRMEHSEMSETAKWPIFVPKHSKMAELILEDSHLET
uniref:Uncharacterized protein n=1 Tax=Meloidogyne javanica TaxID=6303 RepID=A0A915N6U8_MELJA